MLGKTLAFILGMVLLIGLCVFWPSKHKEECVTYNHMLQEQVSQDGAYVIHKEGKTWICTL